MRSLSFFRLQLSNLKRKQGVGKDGSAQYPILFKPLHLCMESLTICRIKIHSTRNAVSLFETPNFNYRRLRCYRDLDKKQREKSLKSLKGQGIYLKPQKIAKPVYVKKKLNRG